MFERLPETIRVPLDSIDLPDYYVLVVPDTKEPFPFRKFFLVHEPTETARFMFGCVVQADELAAEMAEFAAPQYMLDILVEE